MAGTSLKEQLAKLRTPQTNLLQDIRKRPSFMFDANEAATITRATFYEIGKNGLDELISIDSNFEQFIDSLFNESAIYLQRAVETKEVNEQLDGEIRNFLYHLIPYFQIRPAYCVLEWLIVRYNIHSFNTDDMVFFILPYYHTKLFARALQVVDIRSHASRWNWLNGVRKEAIPLSRTMLFTRCANDAFLLKMICKKTVEAIELIGDSCDMSVLINFYTSCLVGVIQYASPLTELHITHMLPSLFQALESNNRTFTLAAFVVINFMLSKTKLKKNVVKVIIKKILKIKKNVHEEQTLLMLSIYQKYSSVVLPIVSFKTIAKKDWFIKNLIRISKYPEGFNVFPLCLHVLNQCIEYVKVNENVADLNENDADILKKIKTLSMHIVMNIKFDDLEVTQLLDMVKDSVAPSTSEDSSSDKKLTKNKNLIKYCTKLLETIEKQYPNAWDKFIYKHTVDHSVNLNEAQLKIFKLNVEDNASCSDIYFKLNDTKPGLRAETIKFLSKTNENLRESIQITLRELWKDDENIVVNALLTLPERLWCIEVKNIINILVDHYEKYIDKPKQNRDTTEMMLKAFLNSDLLQNVEDDSDRIQLMFAILPFMFASKSLLKIIVSSKYLKQSIVLNQFSNVKDDNDLWNVLTTLKHVPATDDLMTTLQSSVIEKPIYVTFSCVLLTLSIEHNAFDMLTKLFKCVSKYFENKKIVCKNSNKNLEHFSCENFIQCLKIAEKDKLPLEIYSYFIYRFISMINLSDDTSTTHQLWRYSSNTPLSNLLVEVFCTFVNKCNTYEKNGLVHHLDGYVNIIRMFRDKFIPSVHEQVKFYCNLSINMNCDVNLSLWSLYMLNSLIKKADTSIHESYLPFFLILIYSTNESVRKLSLDSLCCFTNTFKGILKSEDLHVKNFIKEVVSYREEIYLDHTTLIQYVGMILGGKVYKGILDNVVRAIVDEQTPEHVIVQLLEIISNISSCGIFKSLIPLADRMLQDTLSDNSMERKRTIGQPRSTIVHLILKRFSQCAADVLNDSECWEFVQKCARNYRTVLDVDEGTTLCANILVGNINADIYDGLTNVGKKRLLNLLLEIKVATENDEILVCIKTFIKKIALDCNLIEPILKSMATGPDTKEKGIQHRRRRTVELPNEELLKSDEWKHGIAALECIEHKKKLDNTQVLLAHMFQVLKKCLQFEEQIYVEYAKQLCLACIYNCFQKVKDVSTLPSNLFDIDSVVESISISKNPQTHHQALMLLAYIASILPDQVLKKFMPIFTFMGNSILRLDDAYSLQIINKVIEQVVPVILTASQTKKPNKKEADTVENNVTDVLRVFTDAIMDIPDHRRIYLLEKLLNTLNNGEYIYLFLELMFERHVIDPELANVEVVNFKRYSKELKDHPSTSMPKRLKLALHVCSKYSLPILVETSYKLLQFLQMLPCDKDDRFATEEHRRKVTRIIKTEKCTPKQFRHYKYTLLMFTSSLLSSHHFVALMSKHNEVDQDEDAQHQLDELFKKTIEEILKCTQVVSKQVDSDTQYGKYWKGMLSQCYDILDKINALISSHIFINVIKKLLKHKILSLRKRALDMLNWRLQQKHNLEQADLLKLVKPLVSIAINSEDTSNSIEANLNQQTALISLKLFVRSIGEENMDQFIDILDQLMVIFEKQHEPPVLASLILCIAEMCSVLKAHSLSVLPLFMPKLLSMLSESKSCDVITLSIVSSLVKIVENLAVFMSAYLVDILYEGCVLTVSLETIENSDKSAAIKNKLGFLKSKITLDIPNRVVLASVAKCYSRLTLTDNYKAASVLMEILGDSFSSENFVFNNEVTEFFINALQFRCVKDLDEESICMVETSVIQALVKLILKLSESNFKPLFNKLYDWAFNHNDGHRDRIITFFNLTSHVAEALKSLFVLFAGIIVKDCSIILDKTQKSKHETLYFEEEHKNVMVLESVLRTLLSIFTHDLHQFMTKERFNMIMQHLVDHLENKLPNFEQRCRTLVQPCIVQFAASSSDDVQWKNLNYEILLKTRDADSYVRLMSLECILMLATKLGDNFLPLLPETVPFLAELLEDENPQVEKACHKVVQEMEHLLGEPISKYF